MMPPNAPDNLFHILRQRRRSEAKQSPNDGIGLISQCVQEQGNAALHKPFVYRLSVLSMRSV
jgi:hypothetical protein